MTKETNGKVKAKKSKVTIDLSIPIFDLKGDPVKDNLTGEQKDMTLGSALIGVLCAPDNSTKPKDRIRRGHLAMLLHEANGSIDVVRDDAEMMLKAIEDLIPLPLVAAKLSDALKSMME